MGKGFEELKKLKKNKPVSTLGGVDKPAFAESNDSNDERNVTEKVAKIKKRNWTFVVYPESAPDEWMEILRQSGLQIALSPIHDKDINPDGSPKKPHWHVIAVYGNPTTFNNVRNLTDRLNSPMPIPLDSVKGMYRYFTHKDNPEKVQYDEKEICHLNGFSVLNFSELSKNEVVQIKKELCNLIRMNQFTEYSQLCDFVMTNDVFFDVVSGHTIFFREYLKGCWREKKTSVQLQKNELDKLAADAITDEED